MVKMSRSFPFTGFVTNLVGETNIFDGFFNQQYQTISNDGILLLIATY